MANLCGICIGLITIIVKAGSQPTYSGSNFPGPEPPQILMKALKSTPPQETSPAIRALDNFRNTIGGPQFGNPGVPSGVRKQTNQFHMPVTPSMKLMVTKWATHLGHKAYYEAHGCVDPSTTLLGREAQMAGMALMMGCGNFQAGEVCEMAQLAHAGGQGANMRSMLQYMMGKDTKHMLEECLTPSTLMNGVLGGMMSSPQSQAGYVTPLSAAAKSKTKNGKVDCSSVSQMLMMSSAHEGLLNPDALEQIGIMRNRYFKMTCQENVILGSLPYRLCCPGYVKPPTMQEAMMLKGMGGA